MLESQRPIKTPVKICGITEVKHADTAANAGADYLGFVFFEKSPRHLTLDAACTLKAQLPPQLHSGPKRFGVFVNPSMTYLQSAIQALALDGVQLHGQEGPEFCADVKNKLGVDVWKAFGVMTEEDLKLAAPFYGTVDGFFFDAKAPKNAVQPGGNARAFPWAILQNFKGPHPWLLAGGLNADNVVEALRASGARKGGMGVDVSSGVESIPGKKSSKKIEAFLSAAKAAT